MFACTTYITLMKDQIIYTKEKLIHRLEEIAALGWVPNTRHGNHGGVGNTLEELLGITENNLPIPNAAEWELKAQRQKSRGSSLTTLFHMEPSPRAFHFVPQIFLLKYGWPHQRAGKEYPDTEMSFRQTIHAQTPSDRGFIVSVDRYSKRVLVSFDSKSVASKHGEWLGTVSERVGLGELNPQPYWGFDDLGNKAGTKLLNCFYVQAKVQKKEGKEFYHFHKVMMLQQFSFEAFLSALENGKILIDFDARTGHNHGTKFRIRQDCLSTLYKESTLIIGE
jgi:hypothetical protein